MATYFRKYYFEFKDHHEVNPATWRVDIMDSQGAVPTEPIFITASENPLTIERLDAGEDKTSYIIGRQITISYEFTGEPEIPLPTEFFEADERRFRVEVQKNGVLDGVYYIKPDFSEYDHKYPPFTVKLKATDGFSFAKAVPFDIYGDDELLLYDKVSWYEAIMTRALLQILDADTKINVINSLYPNNIEPGVKLLFGCFVHTDIFYDFVTGAKTVHDVLTAFCKAFYARCFIAQNQVWFIRSQDLTGDAFTAEQYEDADTVNEVTIPGFVRSVGATTEHDALVVDNDGRIRMIPAVKKAEFEVDYKGVNRLQNFQWVIWDGTDFEDWFRETNLGEQITLDQVGTGTIEDPYRVFIPYPNTTNGFRFWQIIPVGTVDVGDIIDLEVKVQFANVKFVGIRLCITTPNPPFDDALYVMEQDGTWTGAGSDPFLISRSGKKTISTIKVKSEPVPTSAVEGTGPFMGPFGIRLEIFKPSNPEALDPGEPDGVQIYPIKLGVISLASKGRHLTITNQAQFSYTKEVEKFTFIDTGEEGVSNSTFTGVSKTPEDGGWDNTKPGVNPGDIERQMARAHIDQYPRSVTSWEGSLYSNSLDFFNVIEFASLPGKRFMQMTDNYNVKTCTHECVLMEVFQEGNAAMDIIEYDIEDERD